MSERYSRLYTLPENLYLEGSPVLIAAGALLKDSKTEKVLAQLKMCNLYHSPLTACKVHIRAFEPGGAELEGVDAHSYLDIRIAKGKDFGSQEAVYLPDNTTRRISVCVVQAVFEDGTVWQHPATEWSQPGFKMQRISELFEDIELQNQYSKEVGGRCTYVPEVLGSLSLCTCGALNLTDEGSCHVCGRKMKDLLSALDVEELTRKKDARIAKEEAERIERERIAEAEQKERERREEAQRIEREKAANERQKKKRTVILAGSFVSLIVLAIFVLFSFVLPMIKYNKAVELYNTGTYNEAIEAINEIEGFGYNKQQIANADNMRQTMEMYYNAVELYNKGDYAGACKQFAKANNFRDSESKYMESAYQIAVELRNKKDYDAANPIFEALGNYKDSAELVHYHRYTVQHTKVVTCIDDGTDTYICDCGDTYSETIKAQGHSFTQNATCTEGIYCTKCNYEQSPALGHTTDTGVCERCGYNFTKPLVFNGTCHYNISNSVTASQRYDLSSLSLPHGSKRICWYTVIVKVDAKKEGYELGGWNVYLNGGGRFEDGYTISGHYGESGTFKNRICYYDFDENNEEKYLEFTSHDRGVEYSYEITIAPDNTGIPR